MVVIRGRLLLSESRTDEPKGESERCEAAARRVNASSSTARHQIKRADMAQLVERTLGKGEVPSSTLGISTSFNG